LEETVGVKPDDVTVVFEEIAPHMMGKGRHSLLRAAQRQEASRESGSSAQPSLRR
jgi:hypothetical protein